MVGEREGQSEQAGGVGAVVARTEQPDRRSVTVGRRRDDLRMGAAEVGEEVAELGRELVAGLSGVATQGRRRHAVGAGCPAEAEVDAARVERLEGAELFGDGERGVVGEHHTAGADPQGGRGVGQVGDQDRRGGAGDAGHVVVLGHPVAGVAESLDVLRQLDRVGERLGGSGARGHGCQIEDGQRDARGNRLRGHRQGQPPGAVRVFPHTLRAGSGCARSVYYGRGR